MHLCDIVQVFYSCCTSSSKNEITLIRFHFTFLHIFQVKACTFVLDIFQLKATEKSLKMVENLSPCTR